MSQFLLRSFTFIRSIPLLQVDYSSLFSLFCRCSFACRIKSLLTRADKPSGNLSEAPPQLQSMAHGPASSTPSVSPNDPPQSNPPAASIALSPVMEEHTREMQSNSSSSSNYSGSITSYTIDEPPVNRNNLSIAETKHTIREHRYLEWDTPLADILALSPTVSSDEPIDLPTEKPTGAISNTNSPSTFPSPRPRHEPQIPPKFFKIKDPFTWNRTQKFIVTVICCYSTITAAWASAGYAMGVNYMVQEWKVDKHQVMLGLPMFTIGFSLTPMIMSPISEVRWVP